MRGPFADVRPEERRGALAAFSTLFGIMASHTLLETARDALFLARLSPSELPFAYFAMAILAIAVSHGPWRLPRRLRGRRSLAVLLAVCGAVTVAFWTLGLPRHPWALRALYIWTGLAGTLAALRFWMVLGETYTVAQAKRIYRLVAVGSLLGAVFGATAARVIAGLVPSQHLVLASGLTLLVTALGPAARLRRPDAHPARDRGTTSLLADLRLVGTNQYVKGLGGLVLVSTVALTLADYVFKSAVSRSVPAEEMGTFFASVYAVLNLLALAVQLFLMGWALRVLGLHRSLWLLPAFLFVGAAGVTLGGGLLAALLLKGSDGALRNSFHRTGMELLFVPLPDGIRARAKPLIDVVGQRGGQALASVLILGEIAQGRGTTVIALVAAALCVVWIFWTAELRAHYLDLFRAALREGVIRERVDLEALDLNSLEALFSGLNSRDDREVVAAMDLLAEERRVRLIPALILFHPSRAVVLRALALFGASGRTDFVPVADRLLAHPDEEVRAAALAARSMAVPEEPVLREAGRDPSPLVRATAMVGLAAGGWVTDEMQSALDDLLRQPGLEARRALAWALRQRPVPVFADVLIGLADTADEAVQENAAHALAALKETRALPAVIPMLASRRARGAAREALLAFGEVALPFLEEALADETLPHEVRRHVPRTISRFPAAKAAPVLMRRLLAEPDGMVRYKILRGLNRIAAENPDVALDRAVLADATRRTLESIFRLIDWRLTLARGAVEVPARATSGHELLAQVLRDKETHAVERLFRLLGLQHRGEDFEGIYRGLRSPEPKVRAGSRELLENLLDPLVREAVLALVDDVPDDRRLLGSAGLYRPRPLGYEELLATLLDQPGETLRSITAYHVGETGLVALRPRLEAYRESRTGLFVLRVVERALALLDRPAHAHA